MRDQECRYREYPHWEEVMAGWPPTWEFRLREDWKSFDRTLPGARAVYPETREEPANAGRTDAICDYAQIASLSEATRREQRKDESCRPLYNAWSGIHKKL